MALKNKRYFWIQLAQDFFKSKEMKSLRKIAGGDTHTIIYLKMMLISLEDGGHIYYDGLADNGKRNFSYIRAILTNWKNDGVLTIAAVEERERAYKESKIKGQSGNQKSNVPKWSQPNYVNTTSEETKEELEKRKQEMLKRLDNGGG